MTAPIFDLAAELKAKAAIMPEDILALRRVAWPDGRIDPLEADTIFDLNTAITRPPREWIDFFVEAISNYVVHQQAPIGYVDEAQAAWLIGKIDSDGRVDSLGELELLAKILEDATNVPDAFKSYALKQIEGIVLTSTGPTRDGGALDANTINATECKLLRRIIFAQASDGPACVSRAEADLLFRVKDATLGATNAPEWQALFVQGVGNHLMAHSGYHPLARADAARLDAFMGDTHASVGAFLGRMAKTGFAAGFDDVFGAKAVVDHDADVAADRAIAPAERDWLTAKVRCEGDLDPLEQALLAFVAEESGGPIRV